MPEMIESKESCLEVLRSGAECWNRWRLEKNKAWPCRENDYLEVRPIDLSGADLRGLQLHGALLDLADLRTADLTGTELNHAKLRWARLDHAVVAEANFFGANLNHSTLKAATMCRSSFQRASLLGADLCGCDLTRTLYMWADLRASSWNRSVLDEASFSDADLSGASMIGVRANNAEFKRALLRASDFGDADLREVDFVEARLLGANLRGANLTRARIGDTLLADCDLSGCLSLSTVIHASHSIVDVQTIHRSAGDIPDDFLRSAGVPDDVLGYLRAAGRPQPRFHSCVISYSSRDQAFVDKLYHDLQVQGVRCWFAPKDLKIGARIRVEVENAIRTYDKLLLVLSHDSVASQWVEHEVESALNKERDCGKTVLFPIRLDCTPFQADSGWPALIRRTRNIGDFSEWSNAQKYDEVLTRLIADLRSEGANKGA